MCRQAVHPAAISGGQFPALTVKYAKVLSHEDWLVSWDRTSGIYLLDPDENEPSWKLLDWSGSGPAIGDRWVYGKWVYLEEHDVFAGIATHKTGFWIYKQPRKMDATVFSPIQVQSLIDRAEPGSVVTIPPGNYGTGLHINKAPTVKLAGVDNDRR